MNATPHSATVPDALFDDPDREARWRARFTAPRVSLPRWARDAPDRCLYTSNASGAREVYAWDRVTGTHRQVTDRPHGTHEATITPDGEQVWWFADTDGDEFGQWMTEPFAGRPVDEQPQPGLPGTAPGYPAGLDLGRRIAAVGSSTDEGTTVWVSRGGAAQVVYRSEHDAGVGALSRDERLLAIMHSEHGDSRHPAVRVLGIGPDATGAVVAEKWDGPGKGLEVLSFAPIDGDSRLLLAHERRCRQELLVWDVANDTETEIMLDLPGEVAADWYPDGTALLVDHRHAARSTLHLYKLATRELITLDIPRGTVGGAAVRPDGTVEYAWSCAAESPSIRALYTDGTDRALLVSHGESAPGSQPLTDQFVPTPHGPGPHATVHALVARPPDAPDGPLPTVFLLHGGPHEADEDRFSADRALWLDAGFAVVHANYRGSIGYGSAWRDAIEGRPGLSELEDVAAVHDWAVSSGFVDPARCVVEGWSWGGYLALLALGTQPQRWAAGVAGIPVGDYVAAYADEAEPLRAFDRALFGGSPEELPELYRRSSPISYVADVRAPVLVLAGENDPRCPIRQIDNYLARLAKLGKPHRCYRYNAGHGSLVIAENLRHAAVEVAFVREVLDGVFTVDQQRGNASKAG